MVAKVYGLPIAPVAVRNGRSGAARPIEGPERDEVFTAGRLWDVGKNVAALDKAAARLPWPTRAAGDTVGPNGAHVGFQTIVAAGYLSEEEVRRRLAARPIFVAPARFEPFGLAVLEAAQAGCALVLNDIATFRELWDGAALFVDADDDIALADAIQTLIDDRAQRRALGRAAHRRSGRYTVEAMAAGTIAAYQRCLGTQTAAQACTA